MNAFDKIDLLVKERDDALEERDQARRDRDFIFHNNLKIEKERDEARDEVVRLCKTVITTPEPSRLEIASRIMQGWAANPNVSHETLTRIRTNAIAMQIADALIKEAREAQS